MPVWLPLSASGVCKGHRAERTDAGLLLWVPHGSASCSNSRQFEISDAAVSAYALFAPGIHFIISETETRRNYLLVGRDNHQHARRFMFGVQQETPTEDPDG